LSAFLKKLVEILMDISCEDKKADWIGGWIREEGYMEEITSYLITCHTTNQSRVFGIRNFYSATSVKMRRAGLVCRAQQQRECIIRNQRRDMCCRKMIA